MRFRAQLLTDYFCMLWLLYRWFHSILLRVRHLRPCNILLRIMCFWTQLLAAYFCMFRLMHSLPLRNRFCTLHRLTLGNRLRLLRRLTLGYRSRLLH